MRNLRIFLLLFLLPFMLFANEKDYEKIVKDIKIAFDNVLVEYQNGNTQKAVMDTQNAYFGLFEDIESAIRINISAKKAYALEKQFGQIRKAIKANETPEQIKERIDKLNAEINEVLPKILGGHRLVGEYSETPQNTPSDFDTSKFSKEWRFVFTSIKTSLENAINSYENGDLAAARKFIEDAKFIHYRNTKFEIAIRQFLDKGQSIDGDIQRKMSEAISGIKNGLSKDDFKAKLNAVTLAIYDAANKLPSDSVSVAKVELPAEILDDDSDESGADFSQVVANINQKMQNVLEIYKNGKVDKAMSNAQDIYFDEFEASGMENKVGAIDVNLKTAIEGTFSQIVALMKSNKDENTIKTAMDTLNSQLLTALEKTSSESSPWALFIWSLTIILREGFEALIIVAAVVAYLLKTGNASKMGRVVYSSVGVAVILSFVMAWIMNVIFGSAAGQKRELMEGITMLVAVGLLFYVGFWLLSNAGAKKWSEYIKNQVNESISSNSATALWWTVFLAVFREGAETVLFYQALIFDAKNALGHTMIATGFGVGLVVLLVVYYIFKIFAIKIPIKPFFLFTSAIIFYMSIVFVGKGVMELVEGKIFIPTTIEGLKFPEWAGSWFGLQPYYESLVPQILMILALVIGVLIMKSKQKQS
ncbi:FTR1 family iron permease [Campylobacter gastrosuis]|uniref:FTR1 family iron permease n=1 Tax=Campylobacter gastrosuis TaxID=2974576 RepID=A0ABT7HN06_9BACT|nr:FTR1 family protein [Campylobacter gastrosuis]MDL0087782.1 FTR1 family iron permease [Campylobacter gastrosuis]MDL0087993.1 FTR1 family iron permease [Campylobacter gastrosuis]